MSRTQVGTHALRLLVSIGGPGLALGIGLAASLDERPGALGLFLLAVVAATVVGGPWYGLAATALSVPAAIYYFLPPARSFSVDSDDGVRLGIYCFLAVVISLLLGRAWRGRREAQQAVADRDVALEAVRASERRLVETLDDTSTATWEWDVGTGSFVASSSLGALLGLPPGAALAGPEDVLDRLHPADRDRALETGKRVLDEGGGGDAEVRVVRDDGAVRWLSNRSTVLRDASGPVVKVRGLVRDVTDGRRRADGLRFLSEASELLLGPAALEDALRALARLAVERVGDWCAVTLGDPGPGGFATVAHADPLQEALASALGARFPTAASRPGPVREALTAGRAQLVADVDDRLLEAGAASEDHLRLLRALGLRSAIVAPIVGEESVLGLVVLATAGSGNRLDGHDLAVVEEVTRRVAAALADAGRPEQERAARELAERSSLQRLRLQAVTESLAAALTPASVAEVAVQEGVTALEADFAVVHLVRGDGRLEPAGWAGYPEDLLDDVRRAAGEADGVAAAAARSGELLVLETQEEIVARHPSAELLVRQAGERAALAAPILSARGVLGVFQVGYRSPRLIAPDTRALALTLARQCAQALERARLFEAERAYRSGIDRILEIVPRIQAGGSPREVARTICRAAMDAFEVDAAQLFDVERDGLYLVDGEGISPALHHGARIPRDDLPVFEQTIGEARPLFVADLLEDVRGLALEHARATGLRSSVRVPIATLGAADRLLVLSWRRVVAKPDATTLALMRRFADQAALALAQAERIEAEASAARIAGRVASLQHVTGQLSAALTVEEVVDVAAGQGLAVLGARAGAIAIVTGDGFELELAAATGYEGSALETSARIPVDAPLPLADAVRERRTVVVRSPTERVRRRAGTDGRSFAAGEGVLVACPFVVGDRAIGGLALSIPGGRVVDGDDLAFIESFASHVAQALERARLYRREHSIAETLQRSVVPDELSQPERLAVAARYLPGSDGLDVGGDWYDLIELGDGNVCFAVGDVVGKGVEAAAMMAQLRNALRAYALEGFGPAATLERLNRLAQISGAQFATLLVVELDPAGERCRVAVAGHPPLLVIDPRRKAEYVHGAGALPLGVVDEVDYREVELPVEPGSTLVLYTDGLVESRRSSLEHGLARLLESANEFDGSVDALVDHLLDSLLDERQDDVALLAVRLQPVPAEVLDLQVRSELDALPSVREELRRWLERVGVSPDEAHDICLASWEACANAVEHAQHPSEPLVDVLAEGDEGEVRIRIRDYGRWRPPRARPDRGLGLRLIEGLMDELDITPSSTGTVVSMRRRLDQVGARR